MLPSFPTLSLVFTATLLLLVIVPPSNSQALSNVPKLHSSAALSPLSTQNQNPEPTAHPQNNNPTNIGAVTITKDGPVSTQYHGLGSNAPTLAGVGIPPLRVPDTSDAPFMQSSSLPQGFVFICVGAALGFLGACVIAWRGLVAWSLHRSVRRAAAAKYASEKKSIMHGKAPPSGYSSLHHSATASMDKFPYAHSPTHSGDGYRTNKTTNPAKHTAPFATSASSLFYSPTAGVAQPGGKRTSSYLPAGYYASGASMPAAGANIASLGGYPNQGARQGDNSSPPSTPKRHRRESGGRSHRHDRSASRTFENNDPRSSMYPPRDRGERKSGGRREHY